MKVRSGPSHLLGMKLSAFLLVFLAACGGTVLIDTAPGNDAGAGNDGGTTPTADGGNPTADGGVPPQHTEDAP